LRCACLGCCTSLLGLVVFILPVFLHGTAFGDPPFAIFVAGCWLVLDGLLDAGPLIRLFSFSLGGTLTSKTLPPILRPLKVGQWVFCFSTFAGCFSFLPMSIGRSRPPYPDFAFCLFSPRFSLLGASPVLADGICFIFRALLLLRRIPFTSLSFWPSSRHCFFRLVSWSKSPSGPWDVPLLMKVMF